MLMAKPQPAGQKTIPRAGTLLRARPGHVWVQGYVWWEHAVGQGVVASLNAQGKAELPRRAAAAQELTDQSGAPGMLPAASRGSQTFRVLTRVPVLPCTRFTLVLGAAGGSDTTAYR